MEVLNGSKTLGRARLSFAKQADIDDFVQNLEAFEKGDMASDAWRAFRLLRGTYGQRQEGDLHMMRIKIPQGVLDQPQLHVLADIADEYSRGFAHITTRQNIQLHFMKVHDAELAMRRLADVGITTREACGNSVRNITACPYAGVAEDEVFDVTPYGEALTRYFLRHPLSSSLPRKFKIAFEGCTTDHAFTAINDIGWRAKIQDGRRGFRVTVGGGTAILCRSGATVVEFLPVEDMFAVAEAVIRVFHKLGDFQHKARNRMKFLIKELGWGEVEGGVRPNPRRSPCGGGPCPAVRPAEPAGGDSPTVAASRGPVRRGGAGTHRGGDGTRPRPHTAAPPHPSRPRRPVRALAAHQRAAAAPGRLRHRHRHRPPGRPHRAADAPLRRPGSLLRRRSSTGDRRPEPRPSAGCGPTTCPGCTVALPQQGWDSPALRPSRTSRAARARSLAAWR